ncbi:MAG: ion transporter [Paludibacteraceae bacterium]|nr:ion transporter [Paludibacteraceae bacterium]
MAIIVINSVLIGVETYISHPHITAIQNVILGIFTIEIIIRFIARDSLKSFFSDGWNWFDMILVLIGYVPVSFIPNSSTTMVIRVLRIFRVLRLLRASKEIKLIITVLLKSITAMFYNVILFSIFIYLFAIIGVGLFRLPDPKSLTGEEAKQYELFIQEAPNSPSNSSDPYGSLDEAMFTLFRALTGDDWTDLRYNLVTASEHGVIKVSSTVVTVYHVLWFVISAFLLLNLVTGAIINNYQMAKEEKDHNTKE